MSLIFSKLVVSKLLISKSRMHNFYANFVKILDICKDFAKNKVNEKGNKVRCGAVPKFSDLEVIALSITAEAAGIDSENLLFTKLETIRDKMPSLISRRQFNARRKKTALLGEEIRKAIANKMDDGQDVFSIDSKPVRVCQNARAKRCRIGYDGNEESAPAWGYCASQQLYYFGYKLHAVCGITGVIHSYDMTPANVHDINFLQDIKWNYSDCMLLGDKGYLNAEIQQDLFSWANIALEVPYRLNQKNWRPPTWAYKKFRKRIETVFSQLNDQFMMIRNYAKKSRGIFTRTAAKVAAFTVSQYVNFINHREIGQVKYALF